MIALVSTLTVRSSRTHAAGAVRLAAPAAVLAFVTSAQATILTFDVQSVTTANAFIPQAYGDRAQTATVSAGGFTLGQSQGNGWTPNVEVSYASTFTGTPSASDAAQNGLRVWRDSEWQGVLYPRSVGTQTAFYDLTFTPDAGYAVRLNSFAADDYNAFQSGHTIRWWLYADSVGGALLAGGPTDIAVAANSVLTLNVPSYANHFGAVVLRIEHVAGAGNDLALDNINFDQMIPTPSAGAVALLGVALAVRRRR